MNEALRNFTVLLWAICAINSNSYAGSHKVTIQEEQQPEAPTVIIGEALSPSGRLKKAIVEQPAGASNPLGNPIVDEEDDDSAASGPDVPAAPVVENAAQPVALVKQSSSSGELQPGQVALPQPSNRIENELYQSGDDIVDVQAFPIKDIQEAETPNIQPTIVAD